MFKLSLKYPLLSEEKLHYLYVKFNFFDMYRARIKPPKREELLFAFLMMLPSNVGKQLSSKYHN